MKIQCNKPKCPIKKAAVGDFDICPACHKNVSTLPTAPEMDCKKILIGGMLLAIMIGGTYYWYSRKKVDNVIEVPNTEVVMRLAGSTTIGSHLVPALVRTFLQSKYKVTNIQTLTQKDSSILIYGQQGKRNMGITIRANGTDAGFNNLSDGQADITMASNKINDAMKSKLSNLGNMTSKENEYTIGMDGIAVIVHAKNPLNTLTIEALARIYSTATGDWSKVGAKVGVINPMAREAGSGTGKFFSEKVMNINNNIRYMGDKVKRYHSNERIALEVGADSNAIGFISMEAYKNLNKDKIKIIELKAAENTASVPFLPQTINNQSYYLSRRLYLYTATAKTASVNEFINFVISDKGQKIVQETGFVGTVSDDEPVDFVKYDNVQYPPEYLAKIKGLKTMPYQIRFETNSSILDSKAEADYKRAITYLASKKKKALLIGFADSRGDADANQSLSEERANAVVEKLRAAGVSSEDALGFGEAVAIGDNTTVEGMSINRRVEIWIKNN